MFRRARYQSGCVYRERRKRGAVWCYRWRDADGHRKVVLGSFPTKALAQKAAQRYRVTINENNHPPLTLGELSSHYEATELSNGSKTPLTCKVYSAYLRNWIIPKWGEHPLSEVKTVAVESWLKGLTLTPGSKVKVRNLMHVLFNHAMRYEWLDRNPITLVRQSGKRQRVPEVLSAEEIALLLAELSEHRTCRTLVFLVASTGLRVSEALGLQWGDIDFAKGEIKLSRGIVRQHIGEMKTEASRKPLPLSSGLADVLTDWRKHSLYPRDDDWVFASPERRGVQPYWADALLYKVVQPAAARAGITKRIGWHTFRHTFATLLKANGEDVKVVQESLRHANSRITLDVYTQAVTPAKREAQAKVIALFPTVPTAGRAKIASA